jgi:hypothetical protein
LLFVASALGLGRLLLDYDAFQLLLSLLLKLAYYLFALLFFCILAFLCLLLVGLILNFFAVVKATSLFRHFHLGRFRHKSEE